MSYRFASQRLVWLHASRQALTSSAEPEVAVLGCGKMPTSLDRCTDFRLFEAVLATTLMM